MQDLSARLLQSTDIRIHMLFYLAEWKINTFHESRPLPRIYSMILYRVTCSYIPLPNVTLSLQNFLQFQFGVFFLLFFIFVNFYWKLLLDTKPFSSPTSYISLCSAFVSSLFLV